MARRARRSSNQPKALAAYRHLTHPFDPQALFSQDRIAAIHDMALRLLEEHGIRILLGEARDLLAKAGCRVAEDMVFFGRDVVTAALETAPATTTLRAPNPERDQPIAEGRLIFCPGGGCPNVTDRVRGRRPGDLSSYSEAVKLAQHFEVMHKLSPAPEPQDIPVHLRHYAMLRTQLAHADKPLAVYARGRAQVEDCFELIQTALGLDGDRFQADPWCSTVINTNSPRLIDAPMAQGLIDFARAGQLSIVTPFCLAGAMAPITVAGALVLQHAEALAGITLSQIARPGAPVLYGGFGSNVDMRSGAPAFGTPEHIQMALGSGQLARLIGLPWRSAAGTASNTTDMQAAQETTMALWGTMQAGATVVLHSAGWLEGGLTFGFEKFLADIEALQVLAHLCHTPEHDDAALGWEALAAVPPGGHFFDTPHTMARYREAFAEPLLADLSSFGTWEDAGGLRSDERATALWQKILAEHRDPDGADARVAAIAELISRRSAEGGAPILE